ncbi:hypothetical protein C380_18310 [Acidovorax sp. KKS102]|uniref:hypothetical protein n=1 Tax=Acidovorax sp. KKS102 TaxID=358220 RepID=UPI00028AE8B6|nr:hypothetical protein [Acidovorax sp. KKS102]AFU47356.1 hypothetical protein C380_18310 [Acidovorax sp. KKS102]
MQAIIQKDNGLVIFLLEDAAAVRISEAGLVGARRAPGITADNHAHLVDVPDNPDYAAGHWCYLGGQWQVRDEAAWAQYVAARDAARAQARAAELRAELFAEYERRTHAISAGYPDSERESWPVQISEARALQADPSAFTPWIDAAASARGLDRSELALRIVALDNAYRTIHGTLTGVRQRIEGDIDAAADDLAALSAINVMEGWPA